MDPTDLFKKKRGGVTERKSHKESHSPVLFKGESYPHGPIPNPSTLFQSPLISYVIGKRLSTKFPESVFSRSSKTTSQESFKL